MTEMDQLVLTIGLPYSGKTTWARTAGCPVVQPDAIRLAMTGQRFYPPAEPLVWAAAKLMVRSLFLAGHRTVILDATNTTRKRRDEWRDPSWRRTFYELRTPREECEVRALRAGDMEIMGIIARMADAFEPPVPDELNGG